MSKQFFLRLAVWIAILYILFLALFAFDAFIPGETLIHNLTGFVIHLIPNIILSVGLYLSWRYPNIGSALFLTFFISAVFFFSGNNLTVQLLIFSPLLIIGGLFFLADKKSVN